MRNIQDIPETMIHHHSTMESSCGEGVQRFNVPHARPFPSMHGGHHDGFKIQKPRDIAPMTIPEMYTYLLMK